MPTARTKSDPNGPCSVNDLLELYEEMIVPHFQRGLVWEDTSVSLLLESLYYETPCGSIILWTPANPWQQGTPLGKNPRYLIVDGQQRIRSLRNVFKEDVDESMHCTEEDDDSAVDMENGGSEEYYEGNGIWCLNLGRVSEFEEDFPGGKRFRLFRRANDPRKAVKDVRGAPLRDERRCYLYAGSLSIQMRI